MRRAPRDVAKSPTVRLIFGALAVAIFALSLQKEWDIEIAFSQPTHGFVAKVSKDSKDKAGGDKVAAVAAVALVWAPSLTPQVLALANTQPFPVPVLFRSVSVRAPPAA